MEKKFMTKKKKTKKSKTCKRDSVRHVTKSKLAETFGTSVATVDAWLRKGCPYVEKGAKNKPWVLDLKAVTKWVKNYKEPSRNGTSTLADLQHAKWRLIQAKAAIAELELGKAEGLLIEMSVIKAEVEKAFSMVKKRLIALPSKVAPRLVGKTLTKMKIILDDEVYETLTDLADIDLEEYEKDDSEAKPKHQRNGSSKKKTKVKK